MFEGESAALNKTQGLPATQISPEQKGECPVITHNQVNGGWCECG